MELRYGVMVAQEILVLFVEVRILLSQRNPCNSRGDNKLQKSVTKNGTETGQLSHPTGSLYSILLELCERKKMSFFKPIAYKEYIPAQLHEGEEWYIFFYVENPATGKLKRVKIKFNRVKSVRERRRAALMLVAALNERLSLGWNPLVEKIAPRASVKFKDAVNNFIKVKEKEVEANTLRSYNTFAKKLLVWAEGRGFRENSPVAAFTKASAFDFMEDLERDNNFVAFTYNNHLRFYSTLFHWMVQKGYLPDNPFEDIKPKKKSLRKKKRRVLSDDELQTLWNFLERENIGYMRLCLLCYCCFMRPKEIMLLRCSDLDLKTQTVKVRGEIAKNDNDSVRTIPDAMMRYFAGIDLSHPKWYLFSGKSFMPGKECTWVQRVSDYWRGVVRPATGFGKDVQFYSLKDTGITNMAAAGVPVSFIQQQADHSSLAMTSIYCQRSGKATEELKGVDILNVSE